MQFTPNIIVTRSYELVKTLSNANNIEQLKYQLEDPSIDSQTITSFKSNKYIYSLEHEFNYNADKGQPKIELLISDPDGSFEDSLLNESALQSEITKKIAELTRKSISVSSLTSEILPLINDPIKVYIAYGIGEDLQNWSDPIVAILVAVNLQVAINGIRTYKYTFVPSVNNLFNPPLLSDNESSNSIKDVVFGAGTSLVSVEREIAYTEAAVRDNLTNNIEDLIKKYISKVTRVDYNNVIFLCPKLRLDYPKDALRPTGSIFSPKTLATPNVIDNILKTYKEQFNIDCVKIFEDKLPETIKTYDGIEVLKYIGRKVKNYASDFLFETDSNSVCRGVKLILSTESDSARESIESQSPQVPDLWAPINHIELGINTVAGIRGGIPVNFEVIVESSLSVLSVFKKYKLISSDKEPCVIVGDRQMIRDFIYYNSTPSNTRKNESLYRVDENLKIYPYITDNANYSLQIKKATFKNTNSSFNEKSYVDELALKIGEEEGITTKDLGVVVFTNNVKNANILSLNVENSNNYMTFMAMGVKDNKEKLLIEALRKEYLDKTLNDYNLSVDIITKILEDSKKSTDNILRARDKTGNTVQLYQEKDKVLELFNELLLVNIRREFLGRVSSGDRIVIPNESEISRISDIITNLNNIQIVDGELEIIPSVNNASSESIKQKIYNYIWKYSFKITLKTLPFYHLSNASVITQASIIYSNKLNVMGVDKPDIVERDPFTGVYLILGFKHTLNSRDAYSEFTLLRYANASDIPKAK